MNFGGVSIRNTVEQKVDAERTLPQVSEKNSANNNVIFAQDMQAHFNLFGFFTLNRANAFLFYFFRIMSCK